MKMNNKVKWFRGAKVKGLQHQKHDLNHVLKFQANILGFRKKF